MLSGNKGEGSEIYALFKLLGDKKLFAGDADLNKVEEVLINNGYSLSSRAEELPLDVFIQIANEI